MAVWRMELAVNLDFLSLAGSGEFCLTESEELAAYEESIEQIIVFWWSRTYPADVYLDLDLSQWERKNGMSFRVLPTKNNRGNI